MDQITKLYKSRAEDLQRQIFILENQLNGLNEEWYKPWTWFGTSEEKSKEPQKTEQSEAEKPYPLLPMDNGTYKDQKTGKFYRDAKGTKPVTEDDTPQTTSDIPGPRQARTQESGDSLPGWAWPAIIAGTVAIPSIGFWGFKQIRQVKAENARLRALNSRTALTDEQLKQIQMRGPAEQAEAEARARGAQREARVSASRQRVARTTEPDVIQTAQDTAAKTAAERTSAETEASWQRARSTKPVLGPDGNPIYTDPVTGTRFNEKGTGSVYFTKTESPLESPTNARVSTGRGASAVAALEPPQMPRTPQEWIDAFKRGVQPDIEAAKMTGRDVGRVAGTLGRGALKTASTLGQATPEGAATTIASDIASGLGLGAEFASGIGMLPLAYLAYEQQAGDPRGDAMVGMLDAQRAEKAAQQRKAIRAMNPVTGAIDALQDIANQKREAEQLRQYEEEEKKRQKQEQESSWSSAMAKGMASYHP